MRGDGKQAVDDNETSGPETSYIPVVMGTDA